MNKNNKKIFLDTCFLASFSIDYHKDFARAQKLLTFLTIEKYKMYISPLCFYELWQVIKESEDYDKGTYKVIRTLNRIFKKIYLKILYNEMNFAYYQVVNKLKIVTEKIVSSNLIHIQNLDLSTITIALKNIEESNTKPGDAFHAAIMEQCGISKIVTKNKKDFQKFDIVWF
jgi:predicted nucleic acid-binding protein